MLSYLLFRVGIITLIVRHKSLFSIASRGILHASGVRSIAVLGATLMIMFVPCARAQYFSDPRPPVEVGILEEVYFGDAFIGSPRPEVEELYRTIVRVAFYWQGDRWQSHQYPFERAAKEGSSTFAFWRQRHWYLRESDGRYGDVVSLGEPEVSWRMYFTGQHVISAPADATPRNKEFSGWISHPTRPPKVLCTRKPHPDTDGWSEPTSVEFSDLPQNVVKEIEKYLLNDVVLDEVKRGVRDNDILAGFIKSISCRRNNKRFSIYNVEINYTTEADADIIDSVKMPIYGPIWVGAGPEENGETWLLGNGLRLFFIGDLNGNGDSELVFWIDRYNNNGYLLSNSELHAVATYEWSYH
ncbi:MAG: hypothetical protein IT364_17340 [Candidatus Hydrogenedentes bacterium]|nr:hypothetical protein [Candidatus Hydrogenedentota bacterium]